MLCKQKGGCKLKEFTIIREKNADKKTQAAQEVLFNLPEWFGLEKETRKYIDIASTLPMWVAKDVENKILGFITLSETSKDTVEIHCMAVKKRYHRKGIGKLLIESVETYSKNNCFLIQVKTVDEGNYSVYDHTIRFYESLGFKRLEVFPTLWDAWNPCLILIKQLI
ncbi:TPA: GNAT family N-acetyltransferase [Enterococcus faecalis]